MGAGSYKFYALLERRESYDADVICVAHFASVVACRYACGSPWALQQSSQQVPPGGHESIRNHRSGLIKPSARCRWDGSSSGQALPSYGILATAPAMVMIPNGLDKPLRSRINPRDELSASYLHVVR